MSGSRCRLTSGYGRMRRIALAVMIGIVMALTVALVPATKVSAVGFPGSIVNVATQECLTRAGNSPGSAVFVDPCNGGSLQIWYTVQSWYVYEGVPGGVQFDYAYGSGYACLDDPDWKVNNGTDFEVWPCNAGSNQAFDYPTQSTPLGLVYDYYTKCVDAGSGDWGPVVVYTCNWGWTSEEWQPVTPPNN